MSSSAHDSPYILAYEREQLRIRERAAALKAAFEDGRESYMLENQIVHIPTPPATVKEESIPARKQREALEQIEKTQAMNARLKEKGISFDPKPTPPEASLKPVQADEDELELGEPDMLDPDVVNGFLMMQKGVCPKCAKAEARIAKLEREVEYLRRYGNKDCTAQADQALEDDKS